LPFLPTKKLLVDTGYQGIAKIHPNSEIPKKNTKKKPLNKDDRANNQKISSKRALVENVIGDVKRFNILADKYRNKRKRFGLRFNTIAAIHNCQLEFRITSIIVMLL
jgi:hypothetical protein